MNEISTEKLYLKSSTWESKVKLTHMGINTLIREHRGEFFFYLVKSDKSDMGSKHNLTSEKLFDGVAENHVNFIENNSKIMPIMKVSKRGMFFTTKRWYAYSSLEDSGIHFESEKSFYLDYDEKIKRTEGLYVYDLMYALINLFEPILMNSGNYGVVPKNEKTIHTVETCIEEACDSLPKVFEVYYPKTYDAVKDYISVCHEGSNNLHVKIAASRFIDSFILEYVIIRRLPPLLKSPTLEFLVSHQIASKVYSIISTSGKANLPLHIYSKKNGKKSNMNLRRLLIAKEWINLGLYKLSTLEITKWYNTNIRESNLNPSFEAKKFDIDNDLSKGELFLRTGSNDI